MITKENIIYSEVRQLSYTYIIKPKKILYCIIFFTLIMESLIAELKFPSQIRYINDFFVVILFCFVVPTFVKKFIKARFEIYLIVLVALVCSLAISALINNVPILLVIWGTRNMFRFIMFFIACVCWLDAKDIENLFNKFFVIQIINLLLGLYQYLVLGYSSDNLGGIFGHGNGAGLDSFCGLMIAYYGMAYMNKRTSLWKLIFIMASSLLLAGLAEEKFIFIEVAIVACGCIVLGRISLRKIVMMAIIAGGVFIGIDILTVLFPQSVAILLNPDEFLKYASQTYDVGYVLPRIGAFPIIQAMFFGNSLLKNLFGLGFGNCDTSNFSFFQSDFYKEYGYLNYRWFTDQWTFLECGYIGFIVFLLLFIACVYYMVINRKQIVRENKNIVDASIIFTIITIVMIWYDAALKVDAGYMVYFGVAIGPAVIREAYLKKAIRNKKLNIE